MLKSVLVVAFGLLLCVGCREIKHSPEEQAAIDKYVEKLYARVKADKEKKAQTNAKNLAD
jgi:hypothetical protein